VSTAYLVAYLVVEIPRQGVRLDYHSIEGRSPTMGLMDKAKNAGEDLKGKAKETAGKSTDNERLEADGQQDQAKADLKQRGEQLKDAGDDVSDAFKR
jgi:uncharacterized protein YjbJ (UPF0337 family)